MCQLQWIGKQQQMVPVLMEPISLVREIAVSI
jgi:hypothetical protein